MKGYVFKMLFFLLLATLLNHCSSDPEHDIIARIADQTITVGEFREWLTREYRNKPLNEVTMEEKQKVLQAILDNRRKVLKAKELGLDQYPNYLADKRHYEDRLAASKLYENLVVNEILNEDILRTYYEWTQVNVKAVVIGIGHQGVETYQTNRSAEEAGALAEQYRQGLAKADDPEAYAREVTENPGNPPLQNPYHIGQFGYQADSLIFNANPGEVVGPIHTPWGYLVAKILEKTPVDQPPGYEDKVDNIKKAIWPTFRNRERELRDIYTETFKKKYGATLFEDHIEEFFKILWEWGKTPNSRLEDLTAAQKSIVLAEINNEPYESSELISFFKDRLASEYRRFTSVGVMKNFVNTSLITRAWALEARSRGILEDQEIQQKISAYQLDRLQKILEQQQIDNDIEITEEEITAYYRGHQAKFTNPERIRAWQIAFDDEAKARQAAEEARRGRNFKELFNKAQKIQYDLGFLTRGSSHKVQAEQAIQAGANQIVGPLLLNDLFVVLKTGEYYPSELKPLEEVRPQIRTELFKNKKQTKSEALLNKIRGQYSYYVNESILRRIS